MQSTDTIEHTGIVKSIRENNLIVSIIAHPACSGCHASGICDVSGQEQKEIEAIKSFDVKIGDKVLVVMAKSLGFKALFIGYILPFLIMLSILIIMTALSLSEAITGIAAFISLIPYYFIIYLRKETIGKSFTFTIKKLIQ